MTTNVIHSIGATNTPVTMDYSSIATWAAACPANISSTGTSPQDQQWIGEVYNQGEISMGGFGSQVTLTTIGDTTHRIILRAATGASFKDHASAATNPLRYNPAVGAAITTAASYNAGLLSGGTPFIELGGLQMRSSSNNSTVSFSQAANVGANLHEMIFSDSSSAGSRAGVYLWAQSATVNVVENCLFIAEGTATKMLSAPGSGRNFTIRNNSFGVLGTAGGTGVFAQYNANLIYNNAFFGVTTPLDIGTSATAANNTTDQGSYGSNIPAGTLGTTGAAYTTANFVALSGVTHGAGTGYDFRIPTGSALKDAGSNANGSSSDILGTARPQGTTTDIGAYEFPVISTYVYSPFLTWID